MSLSAWLVLEAVVCLAFVVEAVTGFGATVLAVALGSLVLPVAELVPAFVPVNLLLSAFVAVRDHRAADRPLLFRRVLPAMLMGMPIGMWLFTWFGARAGAVEAAFGLFVLVLALTRLYGRFVGAAVGSLGRVASGLTLGAAGVVHGAFGTGGPLVIVVLSRLGLDKSVFRATLSSLWLALSIPLLFGFYAQGRLGVESLGRSVALLPALMVGLAVGQFLHHRVQADTFALAVYVLLAIAGLVLTLRALGVL